MMNFETPLSFALVKEANGIKISYSDLMEISQGGPVTGLLAINNTEIPYHRFGGPNLYKEDLLFAPILVKKFLGVCFKIAKINIHTLSMQIIGKRRDLIFLDKIENELIFFYTDLDKTILQCCYW